MHSFLLIEFSFFAKRSHLLPGGFARGPPPGGDDGPRAAAPYACQISSRYSRMVRSDEKWPELAMFMSAMRCQVRVSS